MHGKDILFTFGHTPPWAIPTNIGIQSVSRSGNVVTVVTTEPHGLAYSTYSSSTTQTPVVLTGVTDASFNGTFFISGTPTPTTFTFSQTGPDASSGGGSFSATCSGYDVPTGCSEAPYSLTDWDNHVTAVATRANGRIKYWEIWNEANSPGYWKGDLPKLVTMTQHARMIIKAIDPDALILSPSATRNATTQTRCDTTAACGQTWMNQWLSLEGKNYIDVVTFHEYPSQNFQAEQVIDQLALQRGVLTANGVANLPIWDTESSWEQDTNLPDTDDQAAFLARHLLIEDSLGVQRSYWYAYDDPIWGTLWWSPSDPSPSGFVGNTPAATAYIALGAWLKNASFSSACAPISADTTTWTCSMTLGDGTSAEVVWNTSTPKSFSVGSTFVRYGTIDGQTTPITGSTVMISEAPILLIAATSTVLPVSPVSVALSSVRVFPNPWREDQPGNRTITFDQLPSGSTIKIFDVAAHHVCTLSASGGSVSWDLRNDSGDTVASGIYIYLITDSSGAHVRGKLAVIR